MGRLAALAAVAAMLTACGAGAAARHGSTGRERAPLVAIVAPVLGLRGAAPVACDAILTSFPPAGCSGVRVAGYDFSGVAGVRRYSTGAWQTPVLRIAGAWDGRTLHVRRVRRAGASPAAPPIPMRCRERAAAPGLALARRITHGPFATLAAGPCGPTAWVLVPLADRATVGAIHRRYGGHVVVLGWLLAPGRADR